MEISSYGSVLHSFYGITISTAAVNAQEVQSVETESSVLLPVFMSLLGNPNQHRQQAYREYLATKRGSKTRWYFTKDQRDKNLRRNLT